MVLEIFPLLPISPEGPSPKFASPSYSSSAGLRHEVENLRQSPRTGADGQAVVRIVLTDATGSDLFRSIVALIFLLVRIGFVLNTIASVREADRPRQGLS